MVNSISQENFWAYCQEKKIWLSSLLFIGNNYDNIARVWLVRVIETYSKSDFGPPKKFCIKQKQHCNHINKPIVCSWNEKKQLMRNGWCWSGYSAAAKKNTCQAYRHMSFFLPKWISKERKNKTNEWMNEWEFGRKN